MRVQPNTVVAASPISAAASAIWEISIGDNAAVAGFAGFLLDDVSFVLSEKRNREKTNAKKSWSATDSDCSRVAKTRSIWKVFRKKEKEQRV